MMMTTSRKQICPEIAVLTRLIVVLLIVVTVTTAIQSHYQNPADPEKTDLAEKEKARNNFLALHIF